MAPVLSLLSLLVLLPGQLTGPPATQGPTQVGDLLPYELESEHPYRGPQSREPRLVRRDEIYLPGATYVAPFFSRFELAPGDYVIVSSPDGRRSWRYERFGKAELGRTEGFWGIHVSGERLSIELYSAEGRSAWGYSIGTVARGFVALGEKAVCGADDRENARCYEGSDPEIYDNSRAVARLLINGGGLCTGWLVGSEGHLLTNNHCMSTNSAAMNTNYEFMSEGECDESCGQLQCDGTIVTTMGTMIQTSDPFDYTLVQLAVNPTDTYGYFQLRASGPVIGEGLYIPQHPAGRAKEIAVFSTDSHDASGFPEVEDIFTGGGGRLFATYYGDTQGGSSGSPVVAREDHCAVVLHSGAFGCSGLGNTGTSVQQLISDLGANVPADAVVASGPCFVSSDSVFEDGFASGDTSAWSTVVP